MKNHLIKTRAIILNTIEILLVEDSAVQAALFKQTLTQKGYTVTVARNGAQALEMIQQRKPTLIVSDIAMPVMDGYQMCHTIKHDENLRDIPVLLLSQLSDPEDIIRGLNSGADNYVIKDREHQYLLSRVEDLLLSIQLRQQDNTGPSIEVFFDGKTYSINSNRRQILDILIATYDQAVKQNQDLIRLAEELQASEERYRAMLEYTLSGFYRATPDGTFLEVNPAFMKMLGYDSREELLGVKLASALYVSVTDYDIFLEALVSEGAVKDHVAHLRRKDGNEIVIEENARVVRHRNGDLHYIEGFVNDITERKLFEEQLWYRATHDGLTELFNRRYLMEQLARAVSEAKRYKHPLSLCLCDFDAFKPVNDTYGHEVGDEVLIKFSYLLRQELRHVDIAGRLGGDEFCIIFPQVRPNDAFVCVERIRTHLEQRIFTTPDGQIFNVSGTFAIANLASNDMNEKGLLKAADDALYEGKALGGNRTVIHRGNRQNRKETEKSG